MHHPSSFPISHPKAPLGSLCYSIHHQSLPPSGSQGSHRTATAVGLSTLITLHCSYFDLCVLSGELPRHPHLAHCTDSSYIDQTQASRTIHPAHGPLPVPFPFPSFPERRRWEPSPPGRPGDGHLLGHPSNGKSMVNNTLSPMAEGTQRAMRPVKPHHMLGLTRYFPTVLSWGWGLGTFPRQHTVQNIRACVINWGVVRGFMARGWAGARSGRGETVWAPSPP